MNLSELETHLLHRLASATVTDSSVALAAELWEGPTSPFTYDMVAWVLRLLNEQGLVVYTLGYGDVPIRIKVTDEGYTALGYTQRHQLVDQVSHHHRGDPMRPGDRTDFRTHHSSAEYEPCERLSIHDHHEKYPKHEHPPSWWGLREENEMVRGTATPPELKSRAIELHQAGMPLPEIAKQTGLSYYTIYDLVNVRPQIQKAVEAIEPGSLKGLALRAVVDEGSFDTVTKLATYLQRSGRATAPHELMHLLYSLSQEGLVRFRELKRGDHKDLIKIKSTAAARKQFGRTNGVAHGPLHRTDRTDYRTHGARAVGGPIERSTVAARVVESTPDAVELPVQVDSPSAAIETYPIEQEAASWPELERLRERRHAMANREARLDALVKAAEGLRELDPNAYQDLMKRAERVSDETTTMMPLEAEYLRYAEAHDDAQRSG